MATDLCDRLSRLLGCGWDIVRVEIEGGGDAQGELGLVRWKAQLTMVLVEALTTTQGAEVLIMSSRALPWGGEGAHARALIACFISCLLDAQTLRPFATDVVVRVLITQMGSAPRPPPPSPLPPLSCDEDLLVNAVLECLSACPTLPSDAIQNAVDACLRGVLVEEGQAHGQGVAKGRGDVVVMIERMLAFAAAEPSRVAAAVVSAVLVALDAVEREERERVAGVKRDRDAVPTACRTHTPRRMRIVDRLLVRLLCWVTDVHLKSDGRAPRAVAVGVMQALHSLQSDPTWHPTWCIWSSLVVLHVLNPAPSPLSPPPTDHTAALSIPPLPLNWVEQFTKHVAPTHARADTAIHAHTRAHAHYLGQRGRVCINRRGQVWVDVAVTVPPEAPLPSSASFVCSLVGGAETLDLAPYHVAHAIPPHTPRTPRVIRRGSNKHDPVQVLLCELWRHCLSYLSPMRIAWACAPVSRAWNTAADDPALWRGFYHRRWNKVVCASAFVTSRDGGGGQGRDHGNMTLSAEPHSRSSAVVVRGEGLSREVVRVDGGGVKHDAEDGGARCVVCGGGLKLLPGQAAVPPVARRSSMMSTLSSSSSSPPTPLLSSSSTLSSSCSTPRLPPSSSDTSSAATSINGRAAGLVPAEHARTACLLLSTRRKGGGEGGGVSWRRLYGERARVVALNRRENNAMRKGYPYTVCSVVGCTERLRACTSITAHMRSHHKAARKASMHP